MKNKIDFWNRKAASFALRSSCWFEVCPTGRYVGQTFRMSRAMSSSFSTLRVIFFPCGEMAPPDFTSLSLYPQCGQFVDMMMTSYPRKTGGFISGIVSRELPVRLTLKYGMFTFFILVSICFPHDEQLPEKMRTSSLETSS